MEQSGQADTKKKELKHKSKYNDPSIEVPHFLKKRFMRVKRDGAKSVLSIKLFIS